MWHIMEKVQQSYSAMERLLEAVSRGDSDEEVECLIGDCQDLNRVHGKLLALHTAAVSSRPSLLRLLIRYGADVRMSDGFNISALHYAAERCGESVGLLIQHGADIERRDLLQRTPLHWAAYRNAVPCLVLLLRSGADPDAQDSNGETALGMACQKGHLEAIQTLLDYNARPNIANLNGREPLSWLATTIAIGLGSSREDSCLDLMIRALGQVRLGGDPLVLGDETLQESLHPYGFNPRTLQQICRYNLRRDLGCGHLASRVRYLPIPPKLQRFLLLRN